MKPLTRLFLTGLVSCSLLTGAFASGEKWLTSYAEAVKVSQKTGKPILADFTGSDWCGWCMRLHKEVFDTPDFKKWADKNVVLLELDYPHTTPQPDAIKQQNGKLMRRFGYCVRGFPTILFLKSDGKVFGQYGYDEGGPSKWTAMAERLLKPKKSLSRNAVAQQ